MTEVRHDAPRYPFSRMREMLRGRTPIELAFGTERSAASADVVELARRFADDALKRADHAMLDDVRRAARDMLAREYGVTLDEAQVLPVASARGAIATTALMTIEPEDLVLIAEPSYPTLRRVATSMRVDVESLWLDPDQGFLPDVASAPLARRASFVALCHPNNPTGALMSESLVHSLQSVAADDAVIFNDATYGPLTYSEAPCSLLGVSSGRSCVELHAVSKPFRIEGLSIAFLAGDADILERADTYAQFGAPPMSALHARVAIHCFEDAGALAAARADFQQRVAMLHAALTDLGLRPYPAPSGVHVLCPCPTTVCGERVAGPWEAAAVLLDRLNLAAMPWESPDGGYLRFSALCTGADLDRLRALAGRL